MRTKVCFKCETELPITNFYKHPMMGDGYLGKCKPCTRYDVRENRKKRADYYNAYDRERSKNPERIARTINALSPEKKKAYRTFHNAVARGKIQKMPCEVCGEVKVDGHHSDYSRPLDVMWLCRKHHATLHRMEPEHL